MAETTTNQSTPPGIDSTRIASRWRLKTLGFAGLLLGFGVLGLYDFYIAYPKRGLADASYKLRQWFDAAQSAGTLGVTTMAVPDPKAALAELAPKVDELRRAAAGETATARAAAVQLAKQQWLDSLNRMWRLRPEPLLVDTTTRAPDSAAGDAAPPPAAAAFARDIYFDPRSGEGFWVKAGAPITNPAERTALLPTRLLAELTEKWRTTTPPTPLSQLDMAFQWVFVAVGFPGGIYLLVVYLRGATKVYRWEAGPQRLHLPGGHTLTPDQIKELDKTRWHKFYVTLLTHDGARHELDLYRYIPLEDWVLAMEKTAFPATAATPETPTQDAAAPTAAAG